MWEIFDFLLYRNLEERVGHVIVLRLQSIVNFSHD